VSGTGIGTKYTNPATAPAGIGYGISFTPTNDAIVLAHQTTPFVAAYRWSAASGFGTKYSNPTVLPTLQGNRVAVTVSST
jgi:hypothetical protein